LSNLAEEARLVLLQLGIEPGEALEKMHVAPLGDPFTVRIGEQLFTLRKEVCRLIDVEVA
jgi:Fe2+ transport system protein FeoA